MRSNKTVLINYLYHSGFAVGYDEHFLVFDYFKHEPDVENRGINNGYLTDNEMSKKPNPYVFVSHSHYDHYNPVIFDWYNSNSKIQYILSSDVKKKQTQSSCIYMEPYERIDKGNITISTYGSTDIGVSFLVDIDGIRIFHAGDLNWWHWADESTVEELREEDEKFKNEVARFENEKIDILFFPVDPRLGEHYYLGGEYMINKFKPKLFVPMHFADNVGITSRFAKKMSNNGIDIAEITHRGQTIEFTI